MAKDDATWITFTPAEVEAIGGDVAKAYKAMVDAKVKFQDTFTAAARKAGNVPEGKTLKFHYGYGKVNAAVVDAKAGDAGGTAGGFAKLALGG